MLAQSLNNLAELHRLRGDYELALSLFNRSLEVWESALGKNHPNVAITLNNLAALYQAQGNYKLALRCVKNP